MKRTSFLTIATVCAFATAACSGVGSGSGGLVGGAGRSSGDAPMLTPASVTGTGLRNLAFHIIGPGNTRRIGVAPAGSAISLPAGYTYAGPVANAIVTYPDGSSQQASASGAFLPSASSYVLKYPATVGIRALAQPVVKVADPRGGSTAGIGIVAPFASSSSSVKLTGVTVVPDIALVFPGELLTLVAVGTNTDDLVSGLENVQLSWHSASGATIVPIPGTNQATYLAPQVVSGTRSDIVTTTIRPANSALTFSATSSIGTIATASAFAVTGKLTTRSGAAIPGGSALFVEDDPPRAYPSFNFASVAGATGNYRGYLPANTSMVLALSIPSASSPTAAQSVFPAKLLPEGEPDLLTGAPGAKGVANLQIASTGEFDDVKDDAANAIPDPIVSTRDGWLAAELTRIYPFWADSGVLRLFSAHHTNGAPPALVGNGLFARWCYQWQSRGTGSTLILIENSSTTCTSPGNDAFEVTQQSATSFSFVQYRHVSGPYAISGVLNDAANALLVSTASYGQHVTMSGNAVTSDTANVTMRFYGPVSQMRAAPVSLLTMQYAYSSSGATPAVTIANARLVDPNTGLVLATASGSLTRTALATACVGTVSPCYRASTNVTRTYAVSGGTAAHSFSTQDTLNGDGSAVHIVKSVVAGDASAVTFPIGSARARGAGSCIICRSSAGSQLDVDGNTQLGAFTVSAMQISTFSLLNTAEGGAPGTPVTRLSFAL